jgi:adenylate cyclase
MTERNVGVTEDRHILFRIGIHLCDIVEESDGDLMGDGVNIAARIEGIAKTRRDLPLRTSISAGQRPA